MTLTALAIGGPMAGESIIVEDDCPYFRVQKRTLTLCHHAMAIDESGTYTRIKGVTPARFMWQGWKT